MTGRRKEPHAPSDRNVDWTAELLEGVTRLRAEGKTFLQTAEVFSKKLGFYVSRSTIAGKVHKLKLPLPPKNMRLENLAVRAPTPILKTAENAVKAIRSKKKKAGQKKKPEVKSRAAKGTVKAVEPPKKVEQKKKSEMKSSTPPPQPIRPNRTATVHLPQKTFLPEETTKKNSRNSKSSRLPPLRDKLQEEHRERRLCMYDQGKPSRDGTTLCMNTTQYEGGKCSLHNRDELNRARSLRKALSAPKSTESTEEPKDDVPSKAVQGAAAAAE